MEDRSFINLLNPNILKKINIDLELVESFKRVMNKLQTYFNSFGYTEERDYEEFFNKYLINTDTTNNLSIFLNDEPNKIGANGFYTSDGKVICIDKSTVINSDLLDATLCHEFIHFLVMRSNKNADLALMHGNFINEALTEMLTRQIYPRSCAYEPQVKMMEFANLLSNKVNNYSLFLKGQIDAKGYGAASWNNFVEYAEKYQKQMRGKPFRLKDAQNNEFYIQAQRYLIESKIACHKIKTLEEYAEVIKILMQRPVPDEEYINKFLANLDNFLLNNLGLNNNKMQELNKKLLREYRDLIIKKIKYGDNEVYEFEIAGHKLGIDKNGHLYGNEGLIYSYSWDPETKLVVLKVENETIELNLDNIDFTLQREKDLEKENEIIRWFSQNAQTDLKYVDNIASDNLVRLERFTLPVIECFGKKKPINVYVATYSDRIEVLNNVISIGDGKNINLFQYKGVTSLDPKVAAIYVDALGSIDSGKVYLNMSEKFQRAKEIEIILLNIKATLTADQIDNIINQYKNSSEYNIEDYLTDEELKDWALEYYAKLKYEKLSEQEKQQLAQEVIKGKDRFIISQKDDQVDVSLLYGEKTPIAFKAKREILVSSLEHGLYNAYFKKNSEILSKCR